MIEFNVKIADTVFTIRTQFKENKESFADYFTAEPSGLVIEPSREEIRKMLLYFTKKNNCTQEQVILLAEFSAIHKTIAKTMLEHGALLVHGSAVVTGDRAYLFIAPSGTGKSTHTALWKEYLGQSAYIINDDKPFLSPSEKGITVYATPWGIVDKPQTEAVPLYAIVWLERGESNHMEEISSAEMFPKMLKSSLHGDTPTETIAACGLLKKILAGVKTFRMTCTPTIDAAETAYRYLSQHT